MYLHVEYHSISFCRLLPSFHQGVCNPSDKVGIQMPNKAPLLVDQEPGITEKL